jgi:hypothetical protein
MGTDKVFFSMSFLMLVNKAFNLACVYVVSLFRVDRGVHVYPMAICIDTCLEQNSYIMLNI